jgi:hypothetical protein
MLIVLGMQPASADRRHRDHLRCRDPAVGGHRRREYAAGDDTTIIVQTNASVAVGDSPAIVLRDRADITVSSGSVVSAFAVSDNGGYGFTGADTRDPRRRHDYGRPGRAGARARYPH